MFVVEVGRHDCVDLRESENRSGFCWRELEMCNEMAM